MSTEAERLNIVLAARDKELARAIDRNTRKISRFASSSNKQLGAVSKQWDATAAASKRAAASHGRFLNMSGSGRFVLQNTSAQLGDMAVQYESGTAASRIMAQQLPQLLGGFGALGGVLGVVAPLLGTVAAVGIPAVAMLALAGGEADEAADKVKTFSDKLGEAETALGRAEAAMAAASAGGLEDLGDKYGEITDKVRNLSDALADIELRAAKVSVDAVLDDALGSDFQAEVDKMFGAVGGAVVDAGTEKAAEEAKFIRDMIRDTQAQIDMLRAANQAVPQALLADLKLMQQELAAVEGRMADMGALADEMVVDEATLQRLAEMRTRLEDARAAGDFHGMADAMNDIRTALLATGETIDQDVIDGLVLAEDQTRQMAVQLGQADDAAVELGDSTAEIAGGLSPAVAEAVRLASWMGVALDTARTLEAMGPQGMPGQPQGGRGGDPREQGGGFLDWQTREATQFLDNWSPPRPDRPGRGGGSAVERDPEEVRNYTAAIEALEKAYQENDKVAAGYRETLAELRAEYEAGRLSKEEYTDAVDGVQAAFEAASRRADSLRDSAAQTFASIVTGSKSAGDALSSLFSNLANQFATAAFKGIFSGSGIFDTLGSLLSMEGGGYTGGGPRAGGLDGKGGFLAMVHPNESVIDHTKGQAAPAGGSGGGAVQINVNVSGARGNSEISEMVQAGVRQGLEHYDRSVLPRSVQKVKRDPRRIG